MMPALQHIGLKMHVNLNYYFLKSKQMVWITKNRKLLFPYKSLNEGFMTF